MQKLLKISWVLLFVPITSFATTATVQIEENPVRSTPSFFGEIVDNVKYGESVEVLKEQGAWDMVKSKKKSGWIHQSTIAAPKVELTAGSNVDTGASGKEIALAGKGFGEIEKKYQEGHKVNFAWINKMEKFTVKTPEVKQFVKDGGLQGAGL
jgi:hypothetical protein